ncbi:GspH/FimT family pseudopilin [Marinobacterium arenosum]|uniref:GspH/FimT family pseudopilin n=1 Tax=Marinobacterium arenosum TaxID=2862496 RepID=UPI001C97E300|nr:GspH/FimT family pseudopilin [Marinobacterium arenosum]MBY4678235.1 GspH/FimT family pseudopilin [Marinobacterium arenosum]
MQRGLTLLELLISIAVLAILLAVVVPDMSSFWERNRLISAAEAVYSHTQLARSAALARNQDIFIKFGNTGSADWCMALSEDNNCDCTDGSNCTLTNMPAAQLAGSDFSNISLSTDFTGNDSAIEVPRGTALEGGTVTLSSPVSGFSVQVQLNLLGRVKICSDTESRFPAC